MAWRDKKCRVCGKRMVSAFVRVDALTCSNACRQKLYRERKAIGMRIRPQRGVTLDTPGEKVLQPPCESPPPYPKPS